MNELSNNNDNGQLAKVEGNGVILPCDQEHIGEFVSSLLKKKPQKLEKFLFGHYDIEEKDILNFHHLLDQRIKQQNLATLTEITITIIYDDDSSFAVHSLEEFVERVEIEAKRSIAITLEWSYLVKFEDRNTSEKQTIEVSIVTNDESSTFSEVEDGVIRMRRFPKLQQGYICIQVSHTAKTWGHDIESLLIKHARKFIIKENPIRKFMNKHSGKIALFVFLFVMGAAFVHTSISTKNQITSMKESVTKIEKSSPSQEILLQNKMDFVIENTAKGAWHKHYSDNNALLGFTFIMALFLSFWADSSAEKTPKSYLLLTDESRKYKTKMKRRDTKMWLSFVGAIITSIATSLFANVLYAYFIS